MRVLAVTTFLPYPLDHATKIRAWNLLSRLADRHEVTLLTWRRSGDSDASVEACRKRFHSVIVLPGERGTPSVPSRLWIRLMSTVKRIPPYIELMHRTRAAGPDMSGSFDVAVAEDDAGILFMPKVDCPRLVHRHNIFSDTLQGLRRSGALGPMRKMKWTIEMPVWERFDRTLTELADISIVTTPEAGARLKEVVPSARVEVVPNGAEQQEQVVPGPQLKAVFLGTMDYEPNADAVLSFTERMWPKVRQRVPDAEFHIIGRSPMRKVLAIRQPGVIVTGGVDDINRACEGARLGIVPLNAGSGIKTKTLDLLAMGLPVVATGVGCEGIPAGPDQGLIRVDDEAQMVDAVVDLLSDPEKAQRLGAEARRFIAERFSWDAAASIYEELLLSAAKAGAR